MAEQEQVRLAKNLNKEVIFSKPNVLGMGVGYKNAMQNDGDELAVVVLVSHKIPKDALSSAELIPPTVDGVRTDVIQVGELRAMQTRTERWRPAPGGVSLGHYQITAGTFGAIVRDNTSGRRLILSNNHVMANSNAANINDPIIQPGAADGGVVASDVIAYLERFCPIEFLAEPGTCNLARGFAGFGNFLARLTGSAHRVQVIRANQQASNQVDAAVARPVDDRQVLDEILEIGIVSGTLPAELGMSVRKSGRTTGFTTGTITLLDATVDISYGFGRTARFEGQIVTSAMSQGGDSGSLLVAGDQLKAVGLLFAGSEQATIHNPIQDVLDCLQVTI